MNKSGTPEKDLSRIAGCIGLGLEEREGCEGFAIFDLRDPDTIMACSTDPEAPFDLGDVISSLRRILEEMDPAELAAESFDDILAEDDVGSWAVCYGLNLILTVTGEYLPEKPISDQIADLAYREFHETLLQILTEAEESLKESTEIYSSADRQRVRRGSPPGTDEAGGERRETYAEELDH